MTPQTMSYDTLIPFHNEHDFPHDANVSLDVPPPLGTGLPSYWSYNNLLADSACKRDDQKYTDRLLPKPFSVSDFSFVKSNDAAHNACKTEQNIECNIPTQDTFKCDDSIIDSFMSTLDQIEMDIDQDYNPTLLALEFDQPPDVSSIDDEDPFYSFAMIFDEHHQDYAIPKPSVYCTSTGKRQHEYVDSAVFTDVIFSTTTSDTPQGACDEKPSSSNKRIKRSNSSNMMADNSQVLASLKVAMAKSSQSQKMLQDWDRKNGLPASHCQTMVQSARSREQLESGMVLQKWNGVPLMKLLPGAKVKVVRRKFRGVKVPQIQ